MGFLKLTDGNFLGLAEGGALLLTHGEDAPATGTPVGISVDNIGYVKKQVLNLGYVKKEI